APGEAGELPLRRATITSLAMHHSSGHLEVRHSLIELYHLPYDRGSENRGVAVHCIVPAEPDASHQGQYRIRGPNPAPPSAPPRERKYHRHCDMHGGKGRDPASRHQSISNMNSPESPL